MVLPTTVFSRKTEPGAKSYILLVMDPEVMSTHPLPTSGELTLGRSDSADIRLTDPMASRLHARIHVGAPGTFTLEDLGSVNGTRIRDIVLNLGEQVGIVPGEAVTIGSTILMVQENRDLTRLRRVWPHAYLEARLEEEVARSHDTLAPFAVMRLHVEPDPGPRAVADVLAHSLRVPDMLAIYGPREYEVLLPNTAPELAFALARDVTERLRVAGLHSRSGLACYPRDGRSPDILLSLACERVRLPHPPSAASAEGLTVVEDPAMRRVYQLAERVAVGNINVLIVGETGVGKEIMAEAVHRFSPRARAPFLCLNCAALSEALLESELFGHERGAFTGAVEAKAGLLESAPGGTVFLDEVGEMPASLQAKLLRVLENRQVTRVGGLKQRPIDVRFVAATNRTLEAEVTAGRFRRDLYFRLNGVTLHVPPLRERTSEIIPLAQGFLGHFARQLELSAVPTLGGEAAQLLARYAWPGNVRELRNVIERATLICGGDEISPEHLPSETLLANTVPTPPRAASAGAVGAMTCGDDTERDRIVRALAECAGNQSRAAKRLGIARSTLVEKLDAYQIPRPRKPTD